MLKHQEEVNQEVITMCKFQRQTMIDGLMKDFPVVLAEMVADDALSMVDFKILQDCQNVLKKVGTCHSCIKEQASTHSALEIFPRVYYCKRKHLEMSVQVPPPVSGVWAHREGRIELDQENFLEAKNNISTALVSRPFFLCDIPISFAQIQFPFFEFVSWLQSRNDETQQKLEFLE